MDGSHRNKSAGSTSGELQNRPVLLNGPSLILVWNVAMGQEVCLMYIKRARTVTYRIKWMRATSANTSWTRPRSHEPLWSFWFATRATSSTFILRYGISLFCHSCWNGRYSCRHHFQSRSNIYCTVQNYHLEKTPWGRLGWSLNRIRLFGYNEVRYLQSWQILSLQKE